MINKKRVQHIKNLIYAFIILVLFLPLILVSILSFRLLGQIDRLVSKIDQLSAVVSSQSADSLPDNGYVLEPEGQSVNGGFISNATEEQTLGATGKDQAPSASETDSEANGVPSPGNAEDMPSVGAGVISEANEENAPEEAGDSPLADSPAPITNAGFNTGAGETAEPNADSNEASPAGFDAQNTEPPDKNPSDDGINGNPKMGA